MAITENSFTAEEFKAVVEANPEVLKIVTSALPERGFIIRSKDENETFLKNYENEIVTRKTSEYANNLEKDILELTGLPKDTPDQKYYDYLKSAVGKKLESVKTMETELTALKQKKAAEGGSSPEDKQRIKDLELALQKQKDDHTKELTDREQKLTQYKAQGEIEKRMGVIRASYKAALPKTAIDAVEERLFNSLLSNLVFTEDGKILIKDKNGETLKDPKLLEPVKLEDYLTEQLKDLIDEGKKQPGAGSGKSDKDKDKTASKFDGVPSGVTTKVQLADYLYKLGITDENPEFTKIMEDHGKNLRLR